MGTAGSKPSSPHQTQRSKSVSVNNDKGGVVSPTKSASKSKVSNGVVKEQQATEHPTLSQVAPAEIIAPATAANPNTKTIAVAPTPSNVANTAISKTTPRDQAYDSNRFDAGVEIDLATVNFHAVLSDIKVHMVVTTELDFDHNIALRTALGEVSDEQLMAEMAERDLAWNSQLSLDYDMTDHLRAASLPLEASTDDEILAEVKHRKLILHEYIDENVVRETYDFDKILGHGASGKVYLCRHKVNQHYFACKIIHKDPKMNDAQSMSTEMEIMKRLRHRNIVGVYEIYESNTSLWLIMELINGGDLKGYIESHRQQYNEAICARQMKEILLGK
jgi:Protein kinase domain